MLSEEDKSKIKNMSLDEKRQFAFLTLNKLSIILDKIKKEQELNSEISRNNK